MEIKITTYECMSELDYKKFKQSLFSRIDRIILNGFEPEKENVICNGGLGEFRVGSISNSRVVCSFVFANNKNVMDIEQ